MTIIHLEFCNDGGRAHYGSIVSYYICVLERRDAQKRAKHLETFSITNLVSNRYEINTELFRKGHNIYIHAGSSVCDWLKAGFTTVTKRFVFKLLHSSLEIIITLK